MKRDLKLAGFIFLLMAFPFLLLIGVFLFGRIDMEIKNARTEREVFSYVLENKDTLPRQESGDGHIAYKYLPILHDVSIEYGYYYSPSDTYSIYVSSKNKYRKGYRDDGIYGDDLDWYYTSKICDHWYYYEFHDG